MLSHRVVMLLSSRVDAELDWRTEVKYQALGHALELAGCKVETATWRQDNLAALEAQLQGCAAVLVWVNPVDRGIDHGAFEALLQRLHTSGVYVTGQPGVIEQIGTKSVLVSLAGSEWVPEACAHVSAESLLSIQTALDQGKQRVTKQYRGNDGLGIYRWEKLSNDEYLATEASSLQTIRGYDFAEMVALIGSQTSPTNPTIEVPWNPHLVNGIVRCYFCIDRVVGFGYQEVNALHPLALPSEVKKQRFYLTENCGLFTELKRKVEADFIRELTTTTGVAADQLPLIWDADFFINDVAGNRYELCEINASCVSPFPPSAVAFMVNTLLAKLA
jgi:hypothetical protein